MFLSSSKINVNKMRAYCSAAESRISRRVQEIQGKIAQESSEIVKKYRSGDIELAQIRVEGIISEKKMMFVLQTLAIYIGTISSRVDVINMEKTVPANMEISIGSVLYCKNRVLIDEINSICELLERKYKDADTIKNCCDPRISSRLVPVVPGEVEIDTCLSEILQKHGIAYERMTFIQPPPSNNVVDKGMINMPYQSERDISYPSTMFPMNGCNNQSIPLCSNNNYVQMPSNGVNNISSIDDLTKTFNSLGPKGNNAPMNNVNSIPNSNCPQSSHSSGNSIFPQL